MEFIVLIFCIAIVGILAVAPAIVTILIVLTRKPDHQQPDDPLATPKRISAFPVIPLSERSAKSPGED